jgi:flagellin-specific chaperone FliS
LQQLKNRQVSSAITDNLAALLDECDYARFAPGQGDTLEMERHLKQAQQLLHSLMKALSQEKKA